MASRGRRYTNAYGGGLGGHTDGVKQKPGVPWDPPPPPNRRGDYVAMSPSPRHKNKAPSRFQAQTADAIRKKGARRTLRKVKPRRSTRKKRSRR